MQGHIFLNTSLTEAFCIAIVEAASCGLLVVSTKVGGIPEVLPSDMIIFSDTDEDGIIPLKLFIDLLSSIAIAIEKIEANEINPDILHERVKSCYSWTKVASRTEKVYNSILNKPSRTLAHRFIKYNGNGIISGKISVLIIAMVQIIMHILDFTFPASRIDKAFKL